MNLEQDKIGQLIVLEMLVSSLPGAEALPIFSPGNPLPYIPVVHCQASTENQGINIKQPSSRQTEDLDISSVFVASVHIEASPIQTELQ